MNPEVRVAADHRRHERLPYGGAVMAGPGVAPARPVRVLIAGTHSFLTLAVALDQTQTVVESLQRKRRLFPIAVEGMPATCDHAHVIMAACDWDSSHAFAVQLQARLRELVEAQDNRAPLDELVALFMSLSGHLVSLEQQWTDLIHKRFDIISHLCGHV
jgi:hypothetical protein